MITTVTLLGAGLPGSPAHSYPYLVAIWRDDLSLVESFGGYLGDGYIGNLKLEYLLAQKSDRQRRSWVYHHAALRRKAPASHSPNVDLFRAHAKDLAGWRLVIFGNIESTKTVTELQAWGDIPELGNIDKPIHLLTARKLIARPILPPARDLEASQVDLPVSSCPESCRQRELHYQIDPYINWHKPMVLVDNS